MMYTTWSYDQSQQEMGRITKQVTDLQARMADLRDADNKQLRNKLGIELHAKLERTTADINECRRRAHPSYLRTHRDLIASENTSLVNMTTELLDKVFHIPPSNQGRKVDSTWSNTHPASCETVSTYTNGDVAGITIEYKQVHYTGSAKRNPTDKPNPAIGLAVAEAKAATKMAKALQRRADDMVADAERQRRKEQAEKNTARNVRRKEQRAATDRKNATRHRQDAEHYGRELDSAITTIDDLTEENRGLRRDVVRLSDEIIGTKAPTKKKPPVKKAAPRKAK